MELAGRIARLKTGAPDPRPALAALAAEAAGLAAQVADGVAVVPEIGFSELPAAPADFCAMVRARGCVVVRGVFSERTASEWNAALIRYLEVNDAAGTMRARRPERWRDATPQMFSVYWSPPQVEARQSAELAEARRWLNRLWRWEGHFDPDVDCTYADRMRRRLPGDTSLALGPHIDGGTAGRWLDDVASRPYAAALAGDLDRFDPFDAAFRALPSASDANACSVFRSWQGWTALTAQGPGDGTLQVLPLARAIAYVLLRPFAADVPADSLCGAERDAALWLTPRWHADILRALTPIPQVRPGDTVWWHPDLIHAVEPAHAGTGESNVMYVPAAPACPRNRAFLPRQWAAFAEGRSPPDFPADDLETDFSERARPESLSPLGRWQMGVSAADAARDR